MKKITLLIVLCFFTAFVVNAQSNEQIIVKKGRYYQNDKSLKNRELKALLKSDPVSAKMFKKSNTLFATGVIVESAVVIGIIVATGLPLAGLLPGVVVGVPFFLVSQKKVNKAVEIYNSNHAGNP